MMIYLGLDPGATGAIAALDEQGNCLWLRDLTLPFRPMMLSVRDAAWYRGTYDYVLAAVEHQHAFPGMAARSTWALAEAYTYCRLLLEALAISYQTVTAGKWQKRVCGSLPKDRKQRKLAVAEFARRRWPEAELTGPRGKMLDGRSDALCLALYARDVLGGDG